MAKSQPSPTFPSEASTLSVSVRELVENVHLLGLPHFQRGAVWSDHTVALLLESLALDTPCGTLLWWVPKDLHQDFDQHGVRAWSGPEEGTPNFLVLDGQQRTTTLVTVFGPGGTADEWALNPFALDEVRAMDGIGEPKRDLRGSRLFVHLSPLGPDASKSARARRAGVLAQVSLLSDLLDGSSDGWPHGTPCPPEWTVLVAGVRAMASRRFHVEVKRQEGGRYGLREVVSLYNRINSAGEVVQSDERAFAALVALYPPLGDWMASAFRKVHGEPSATRNRWLAREREQHFGFRLFIRVVAYALGLHLDGKPMDPSGVERVDLRARLGGGHDQSEGIKRILLDSESALVSARVAFQDLGCDDLRIVPSPGALRGLFPLLLLFPGLTSDQVRGAVAVLQAVSGKRRDALVAGFLKADTEADALAALFRAVPTREELDGRLKESNSLQSGLVSLLYYLLRSKNVHDLEAGGRRLSADDEVYAPRRAHIVAYAQLREAYGLPARRPGSHPVNRIGNLTYLSDKLNSELSDSLDFLDGLHADLLGSHFIDGGVLDKFASVRTHIIKESDQAVTQGAFDAFCDARRESMAEAMHTWLVELAAPLQGGSNRTPEPRLFDPVTAYIQHHAGHPELKRALLRALRHGASSGNSSSTPVITLTSAGGRGPGRRIRVHQKGGKWIKVGSEAPMREAAIEVLGALLGTPGPDFYLPRENPELAALAINALVDVLTDPTDHAT